MKTVIIIIVVLVLVSVYAFIKPMIKKRWESTQLLKLETEYPRLGFERIESEHFELVKIDELIETNPYYDVRYFPMQKIFLFSYTDDNLHYKIDANGKILGKLTDGALLHSSGVFFHDNYYIDWPLTGDSTKKEYSSVVNQDELSAAEFENYLAKAETIALFRRIVDKPLEWYGRCMIKTGNNWMVIEKKLHITNPDFDFNKDPAKLTLSGHSTKNDSNFIEITDAISPFYAWQDDENPFFVSDFIKEKRVKKKLLNYDINGTARKNGWEGVGLYNWRIGSDTLKFRAYSYKITESSSSLYNPSMNVYKTNLVNDLAFLLVGKSRGDRPKAEVGVYVLRRKKQ